MINQLLLEILIRQIQKGNIETGDIKDSDYKTEVQNRLGD